MFDSGAPNGWLIAVFVRFLLQGDYDVFSLIFFLAVPCVLNMETGSDGA